MKKRYYFILLTIALMQLPAAMFAGADLDQGLKSFVENDYEKAINFCTKALDNPADRQDAAALLAVIYQVCHQDQKEAEAFDKLIEFADDPNPYFYVFQNFAAVKGGFDVPSTEYRKRAEAFLELPKLNATIQSGLNKMLVRHYRANHKFNKIAKPLEEIAPIMTWALTGSFENVSGSGFDKEYGPITKYRQSDRFENKYGSMVRWFPLCEYTPGYWVDLDNHFSKNNSMMYAQTFVEVPADMEVQIRIGFGGSLKFWLNDQLVIRNPKEYNTYQDGYVVNATLGKGTNRLLLQIGESRRGNANFHVRITDRNGVPIPNLTINNTADSYNKELTKPAEVLPQFAEAYFKKRIEAGINPLLNRLLLIKSYSVAQKTELSRHEIELALEEAPGCSYLRVLLAGIFLQDDNETSLNATLEKLKAEDPDNVLSLLLLFQEAVDAENYEESRRILNLYKNSRWADPEKSLSYEISQAVLEKKTESIRQLVENAYKKYPMNADFVAMKYALEKEVGNNSQAIAVLRKYLDAYYNQKLKLTLAGVLFETGDSYGGLALLNQLAADHPEDVTYAAILAQLRFGMGDYESAETQYAKCIKIAPFIGSYHIEIAKTLEEAGKATAAIPYYEEGLKYDPYNYDALHNYRKLKGLDNLFDKFEKSEVYDLVKKAPAKDAYPNDNSIVLLDEKQMVVYAEGGVEQRRILVAKALNSAGVDDWKEYDLPYSYYSRVVIEKAEVIKANGEKIKAETGYSTVVFTGLEAGDAIHIEYKTREYFTGTLARHFWSKHYFQYGVPVLDIRFGIIAPQDRKFAWKMENGSLEPKVSDITAAYQQYSWRMKDMKAIPNDSYLPDLADIAPTLHISTIPDWDFVSSWYHDLADGMAQPDYEIDQLAEELFGKETGLSDREIVDRIYNYVVKEIRYSSLPFRQSGLIPQPASQVVVSRIGDCKDVSTLFVALCRKADIPASLVLVNTRNNGQNAMALPSIEFNHCIARLQLDGKEYFTELTSDMASFNSFESYLRGSFALRVDPEKQGGSPTFLLDPKTRRKNTVLRKSEVTFDSDKMIVKKDLRLNGNRATGARYSYRDLGHSDRVKSLQEGLSKKFSNIEVTDLEFTNGLNELTDPLRYHYTYEVTQPFSRVAGLTLVKVPFSDQFTNGYISQSNTRETPIELWRYTDTDSIVEEMSMVIPDNFDLVELPADIKVSSPFLDFSITFKQEGKVLRLTRTEIVKVDMVEVEQYPEFKKVIDGLVRADDLQLGFKERP